MTLSILHSLGRRAVLGACILIVSVIAATTAHALDPARTLKQYVLTTWTRDQGVPHGLSRMVQDRDGFLWLAAGGGLYRFDGISFERVEVKSKNDTIPVQTLAAAHDGSVWIGRNNGSIEVYRKGVLTEVPFYGSGDPITRIVQTPNGTMWAVDGGSRNFPIAYLSDGRFVPVGADFGLPNDELDLFAASDGSLWVSAFLHPAVLRMAPGSHRFEPINVPVRGTAAISQDPAGRVWLSDKLGTRIVWSAGRLVRNSHLYPTPAFAVAPDAFWDRSGNLWGTIKRNSVFRLSNPFRVGRQYETPPATTESFSIETGLPGYEDREGNLWFFSGSKLQRYSDSAIVSESRLIDVAPFGDVLVSTGDGTVYVGEHDAVYRIQSNEGPVAILKNKGNPTGICAAPDQSIVIVLDSQLIRVSGSKISSIGFPKTPEAGLGGCAFDARGNLWYLSEYAGLFELRNGKWLKHDLGQAAIDNDGFMNLIADASGRLVVRSVEKLSILDPPRRLEFALGGKLNVLSAAPHRVLLGGSWGVGLLQGKRLILPPVWQDPRLRNTDAIIDAPDGNTWMKGTEGLYRVATRELNGSFDYNGGPLHLLALDHDDGADEGHIFNSRQNVARGGDGRLWFGGPAGTRWIDPSLLYRNFVPPGVAVSQVIADGKHYLDPADLRLPAGTSNVEIQFAALSFRRPGKVIAQYRLRGIDPGWIDAGKRRSAFYTNLGAGNYVFEMKAANENGVWSSHIARLMIGIPPTFLQSTWFKMILLFLGVIVLMLMFGLRSRQVAHRTKLQMQARMSERERIAGDLHDTLLQGFQGIILRFHALLSEPVDRPKMERALNQAQGQLEEGRRGLYQLRTADLKSDLAKDLTRLGEELGRDGGIAFRFVRHGVERSLEPLVSIEIERIAVEAMRNAFSHSRAETITTTVTYDERLFQIEVEDDGRGVPESLLQEGRDDEHFGLAVMRERAQRLRGRLTMQSAAGKGTRVTFRLKARLAYDQRISAPWWRRALLPSRPHRRRATTPISSR